MKKEVYICDCCKKEYKERELNSFQMPIYHYYNTEKKGKIVIPHSFSQIVSTHLDLCSPCQNQVAKTLLDLEIYK